MYSLNTAPFFFKSAKVIKYADIRQRYVPIENLLIHTVTSENKHDCFCLYKPIVTAEEMLAIHRNHCVSSKINKIYLIRLNRLHNVLMKFF